MTKNKIVLLLFTIVAAIQLSVPLNMVWQWEDIRQTGQQYQWLTTPVDPYDALRGRYVDLGFKAAQGPLASGEKLSNGQTVYATLGVDANGYAYISTVSANKPETGDYVKARALYLSGGMMHVVLPFNRYYMREDLAPAAEIAYRKSAGKDGRVIVRIKNGMGVVEQLYIGEKTIEERINSY